MMRCFGILLWFLAANAVAAERPNFLFVITDDQSWAHTSYAGFPHVKTPAFDRIAEQGVYFERAFVSAPSCTESRSSILAGQHFWQTGSGAVLWGRYPKEIPNFIHALAGQGYVTAYTGKGWGPGVADDDDKPTGTPFNQQLRKNNVGYIGLAGYSENFEAFVSQHDAALPFFFWAGIFEPHREFLETEDNLYEGHEQDEYWPPVMPYNGRSQKQMTRYLSEIEYADAEVGRMLATLEKHGLLDNTVVIYTSDNGMPFAGAKANLYQYGVQVPLAIRLPGRYAGRTISSNELVSLIDIAPTVLDLAGLDQSARFSGQSLVPLLRSDSGRSWASREFILVGFERHVPDARPDYSTYPMRGLISDDWLYIRNYRNIRWPQGAPPKFMDTFFSHLITYKERKIEPFYADLLEKRPGRELYRPSDPPGAAHNQAADPALADTVKMLDDKLEAALAAAHDPGIKARDYFFRHYKGGPMDREEEGSRP